MTSASSLLRTLLIYAICVPLAIFLGYMIAQPDPLNELSTYYSVTLVLLALVFPILMRWHRFLLILSWNMGFILFFLPARPELWLIFAWVSLALSMLHYIISGKSEFLAAPSVTKPLLVLLAIVLATSFLRGGIGFAAFGSDTYGGKKYLLITSSVIGYFAFIAQRIPPRHVWLYATAFFLGAATQIISDLLPLLPTSLYFIYNIIPPTLGAVESVINGPGSAAGPVARFVGISLGAAGIVWAMMAGFGIRGIFDSHRLWRPILFLGLVMLSLLGGFRSVLIQFLMTFCILFYLEGLTRTRLMPFLLVFLILIGSVGIGFIDRMPLNVQRTVSFLPLKVSPTARADAEVSNKWRLEMWRELVPQIPKYLLLGKGLGFSGTELQALVFIAPGSFGSMASSGSALAGDYHNGPLSILIPFGITGTAVFTWFLTACVRSLYRNYKFGHPLFRRLNAFLLAYFISKLFLFVVVVGSFYSDLAMFVGIIGINISINGGVAKPVVVPRAASAPIPLRIHPARRPVGAASHL